MPGAGTEQPRVRVGVVIVRDDRVLLVKHRREAQEYWLLPGGGVEWGEALAACAARECREEVGLEVEVGPLVAVCESLPPRARRHIVHLCFRAARVTGEVRLGGADARLVAAEWHPLAAWPRLRFVPPIAEALLAALRSDAPAPVYLGPRWRDLP